MCWLISFWDYGRHRRQWPEKPGEYNILVNIFTKIGSCMYLRLRHWLGQKVKVTAGGGTTVDGSPSSSIYSCCKRYCVSNAIRGTWMYVCVCVFLSEIPIVHDSDRSFCPSIPQIWNVDHKSDNEDSVRWPITPEVVNAHARQFTCGVAHFCACINDSAPRSHFSSDFYQIWYADSLWQGQEQVLSTKQPAVIYAHVRNLTSGFWPICLVALNVGIQAKCSHLIGNRGHWIHFRWKFGTGSRINALSCTCDDAKISSSQRRRKWCRAHEMTVPLYGKTGVALNSNITSDFKPLAEIWSKLQMRSEKSPK